MFTITSCLCSWFWTALLLVIPLVNSFFFRMFHFSHIMDLTENYHAENLTKQGLFFCWRLIYNSKLTEKSGSSFLLRKHYPFPTFQFRNLNRHITPPDPSNTPPSRPHPFKTKQKKKKGLFLFSSYILTKRILYVKTNHLRKNEPIQLYQILNKAKRKLKKIKRYTFHYFPQVLSQVDKFNAIKFIQFYTKITATSLFWLSP